MKSNLVTLFIYLFIYIYIYLFILDLLPLNVWSIISSLISSMNKVSQSNKYFGISSDLY